MLRLANLFHFCCVLNQQSLQVRTRVKFEKVLDMTSYFAHSNSRDLAHVDKHTCSDSTTTSGVSACYADESTHTKPRNVSEVSVAPLIYFLTAVIVHHGTANSGHFVAYRRLARDVWIEASDTQVKRVDESRVFNTEAYMLFYAQQDVL